MAKRTFTLNHVIVYVRDLPRSLRFYRDLLGFETIESMSGYARLRGPGGSATLALHATKDGRSPRGSREVVLYFESRNLRAECRRLARRGVTFDDPPKRRPWGWDHAYLRDPDGHRISLYWAGRRRFGRTPPMPASVRRTKVSRPVVGRGPPP